MFTQAKNLIKTIANEFPERNRKIDIRISDFKCKSQLTNKTITGILTLTYIPKLSCIEFVSMREYISSLKQEISLHEDAPILILDALIPIIKPKYMKITIQYYSLPGSGVDIIVSDEYFDKAEKSTKQLRRI